MSISHVITHHTRRHDTEGEARIMHRDAELPVDGKVEELLRDLKRTFCNRAGKSYGHFSEDTGNFPFSSLLKNFYEERADFASFSRDALAHFKLELEKGDAQTDAHLLLWEELLGDERYLFVFLIDHDEALYIDGDLSVQSTTNIGSTLMAARVNLSEWQEGGSTYIGMLRVRAEQALSDAFKNLLGFTDRQLNLVAETEEFLDVVEAYSQTLPEERGKEMRGQVVGYCIEQDMAGQAVEFEALSSTLDESAPEAFSTFVEAAYEERKGFEEKAEDQPPKRQLIPSRARLKQYGRVSGRNNAMSISFDTECLGKNIEYDHENDELVIRGLPKALRTRLLAQLQSKVS